MKNVTSRFSFMQKPMDENERLDFEEKALKALEMEIEDMTLLIKLGTYMMQKTKDMFEMTDDFDVVTIFCYAMLEWKHLSASNVIITYRMKKNIYLKLRTWYCSPAVFGFLQRMLALFFRPGVYKNIFKIIIQRKIYKEPDLITLIISILFIEEISRREAYVIFGDNVQREINLISQ